MAAFSFPLPASGWKEGSSERKREPWLIHIILWSGNPENVSYSHKNTHSHTRRGSPGAHLECHHVWCALSGSQSSSVEPQILSKKEKVCINNRQTGKIIFVSERDSSTFKRVMENTCIMGILTAYLQCGLFVLVYTVVMESICIIFSHVASLLHHSTLKCIGGWYFILYIPTDFCPLCSLKPICSFWRRKSWKKTVSNTSATNLSALFQNVLTLNLASIGNMTLG